MHRNTDNALRLLRDPDGYGTRRGMHTATESRLDTSLRLLGDAWRYLRGRPRLLAMPAIGSLLLALAAAAIYLPFFVLGPDWDSRLMLAAATALMVLPITLVTTVTNVAFLAMVLAAERGEEATLRDGLAAARARWRPILGWTILASGVGGALAFLQRVPGGEWLANVVGWLGGLVWGLATFFVIPIFVLDDVGPIEAVRRSAATFRRRWGEAVVGDIALSFVFGLAMIPGFVLVAAGAIAIEDGSDLGGPVALTAGLVLLAPVIVVSRALTELFVLQLYREDGTGPFSERDLLAAVKPKA